MRDAERPLCHAPDPLTEFLNMDNLILNRDIPADARNQWGVPNPLIYLFVGWRKVLKCGSLINFAGSPPRQDEDYQQVYKVIKT